MNCGEIRDTLLLIPAGEPAEPGVREHLELCADCARTAELARAAWELTAPDRDEPVPAAAVRAVRARIGRRPVRSLRIAAAAAALLAAALWIGRGRPVEEPVRLCDGEISAYLAPAFGELEIQDGPAPGPLGLKSHSVQVTLDDWVMRTEVEEIFVNTTGQRLEGTFVFPLPPDASLSRFAMEVEGTLVEGELVERVRAREVYEGIVRQMKDPALLEWMPGNVFKARVFPIEPYSEKRVILAYTQAPRMWNGAVGYVYPLVSEKTKAHPPEEIAIRASWRFGKPVLRIDCPTHRADVQRRDERSGRAELLLRGVRPAQDFQLRLGMEPDELAVSGHRPGGEDGFLGIAFAPALEGAARPAGTTVFVVDRSARMSEKELEVARRVVDRMIGHLPAEERVGIVAHHVECEVRGPERRREWRDFLWSLKGEGASDVGAALGRAAELSPEGAAIVYVGKGVPTWGETDPGKLADRVRGRAFRAVLVGSGTGEGTLAALGGEIRRIVAGGDTGAEIEAAARTAGLEPLRDLEVAVDGASELVPSVRPSIYPGERIFVFGRYATPGRARVTLRGTLGGRRVERSVEAELPGGPTEHRPLMRLWAQGALEERTAACRRAGEPREAVDPIVAMSRKFQVMTPYTSFLVLESEKAYEQYRIERVKRLDEGEGDGKSSRKAAERAEIEAAQRFRAGERLLQEGRFAEAVQAFEAAEQGAPKDLLPRLRESLGEARIAAKFRRTSDEVEWAELLAKLKTTYEVGEQAKATRADEHYRLAERYYRAGDLEKSRLECEKAMGLNAGHAGAAALRLELDFRLGRGTPAPQEYDRFMSSAIVRHQQTLVEIDGALERGRRLEASGDRASAEREFRKVIEYAKWMPTGVELETRRKAALEQLHGGTPEGRRRIQESQKLYDGALQLHERGEFERAALEARKAMEAWPENPAARKLHTDIRRITLGGRADSGARNLAEDSRDEFRVKVDQGQIEITKHVRDGERYLQARMYEEAKREFENARFKIEAVPYDVKAMTDLLPRLKDSIVKTENARILDERRVEEEKKRSTESEAAAHEVGIKREVTRKMAQLLELSYMALDQKRYDRAIKLADEILLIDPHYAVARELKEDAQKTRHKEEYHSILSRKVERWKQLTDDDEEAVIPYSRTVRFPSREEWSMVSKRLTQSVIWTEGGEDPDLASIRSRLDTMKVDLAFEDAKAEDVLAYLRDRSGLNILLDAAVRDRVDPEKRVTLKGKGLEVGDALRLLNAQLGLDARVTEERVVLLTDPKKAGDFAEARRAFEREEFPRVVELAERMLARDPSLSTAREMRDVAQRMSHMKSGADILKKYLDDWDVQIATAAVRLDPLSKRKPKGISELEEDVAPEDKEILDKLKSIRITIDMQNAPLTAVVDYVREISGLNLHITGIENPDQEVLSVKVRDTVLDGALRLILGPRGKAFEVRDGVVMITTAEALRRRVRLELYDVQDLTYGMQDFPGVDIQIAKGAAPATLRPKAEAPGRRVSPKELLATFKVDLVARTTPLEAIQVLADRSGLSFTIGDDAKAKLERAPAADLAFRGAVLDEVLKRLLEPVGLSHSLAPDGAVVVEARLWTGEDLAARVRAAVFPDSWVEADGKTIQFQNGLLVVRNTAEVHAGIRRFLGELRK